MPDRNSFPPRERDYLHGFTDADYTEMIDTFVVKQRQLPKQLSVRNNANSVSIRVYFLATFDPDSGKRGKQFEHFVKWFLKNDPEWATQVDQIWLWNDYPGQWGRDCGIDLVFKDKSGATWARFLA